MADRTYTDSIGRVWTFVHECPPVPTRSLDWHAWYDVAGMNGPSREALIADIEEEIADSEQCSEQIAGRSER